MKWKKSKKMLWPPNEYIVMSCIFILFKLFIKIIIIFIYNIMISFVFYNLVFVFYNRVMKKIQKVIIIILILGAMLLFWFHLNNILSFLLWVIFYKFLFILKNLNLHRKFKPESLNKIFEWKLKLILKNFFAHSSILFKKRNNVYLLLRVHA